MGDALDVFGILDAACRGDTPSTNASLMPWRDLPTHLRQSNYRSTRRGGRALGQRLRLRLRRQGREYPDLLDWANLSSESCKKDICTVKHLPALLAGADLYLRRLPATEH
jgi:hypothetical protein